MSSLKKKRKITTEKPSPVPSLPDDLLLSCFARVSRLYYPTLSLVSKSFRSLLVSPELNKTRSSLGRTESCLYVCLRFRHDPNPCWFILCRKPDQTLTKDTSINKSSGYVLAPILIPHSPQANYKSLVAVGSSIYAIGGHIKHSPSSSVWILDCQTRMWHKAPSMLINRNYPATNVLDGKIYVAGGFKDFNSSNWMEVFDPKTQAWEPVLNPLIERCSSDVYKSAVIEGEIYMGNEGVVYTPKEDRWEAIEHHYLKAGWEPFSYCSIDNVLYCYSSICGMQWYDSKARCWMDLKSLKRLPNFACYGYGFVRLVDYGAKMVVLWDKNLSSRYENKMIRCAVITLERRNNQKTLEIWGKVEWLDVVLTVPDSYGFMCAVADTV